MRIRHRGLLAAALCALGLGAAAPASAQADAAQIGQIRDRDWEARCQMTSRIFYRLAEQRLGGADPKVAVFSVRQWAAQAGDVGSHHKVDYSKSVESAGKFVYAHPELNRTTLANFGYRSCALHYAFRDDAPRAEAGVMLLLQAATSCQQQHPGDRFNPQLRECLKQETAAIEERVRKARIEVRD